jgi:alpha-beta hydrolase superfamily lysophospholipase
MKSNEFKLKVTDGADIHVYEWLPDDDDKIIGVVQIAHGMADHSGRYADFAKFLTVNYFAVFAIDLRGHGKTAGNLNNLGFLAPKNGWDMLVSDFKQLSQYIHGRYNEKPLYVFGHSGGSFVVRKSILDPEIRVQGAIISGTGGDPGILGHLGVLMTRVIMLFYPAKSPSPVMDKMTFGAYNKPFKPNRTKFDWLSRDNEQVDKYVLDPFCGNVSSIKFFNDLLNAVLFVNMQKNIDKIPKDLAVLIFSGDKDPVGNNGKGVTEVYNKFRKAGLKKVNLKLFDGRHEMLNEINKQEVFQYILDWLKIVQT